MRYSQSPEQIQENIKEVERLLLPNVLDPNSNGQAVKDWLEDSDNGYIVYDSLGPAVDVSVENLHRCVIDLHRAGEIKWSKGHAPKKLNHREISEQNRREVSSESHVELIKRAEEQKRADRLLQWCRDFCANFTSHPHSKTYSGREMLKSALDEQLKKYPNPPNLSQVESIQKALREVEAGLWS
jgi:hypothetical protein